MGAKGLFCVYLHRSDVQKDLFAAEQIEEDRAKRSFRRKECIMLRCPYISDGWTSDSAKPPNEQMADLFQHLADVHHPNDPENSLLEELSGKMRGASIQL